MTIATSGTLFDSALIAGGAASIDTTARASVVGTKKLVRHGRGMSIIPLGDSITQISTTGNNGVWQFSSGYAETAIRLAGPRFRQISNAGIAGQNSTQILARLQTDVLAMNPDVALILAGTNDYQSGMANSAYVTLFNNVQSIVQQCLAANILPVVVVPPVKNGAPAESRLAVPFFYRLAEYWGVPLIDMYQLTVDPVTGLYQTAYSSDGTHPNDTADGIIASVVGSALKNIDTYYAGVYLAAFSELTPSQPANLLRNGSFAQQATAGVPDGWGPNVTGATCTVTTAPASPYTGKEFIYTKTSSGAAYAFYGPSIVPVVGNKLIYSGSMGVSNMSSPAGFHMSLDLAPGNYGNFRPMAAWKQNGEFAFSAELIVPTGTTSASPTLYVNDIGTYKVRNLTLTDRTAQDAIWAPSGN